MGLFFKDVAPALSSSNYAAASTSNNPDSDITNVPSASYPAAAPADTTKDTQHAVFTSPHRVELSIGRLVLAVGFLVFILIAGLFASKYHIQPWDNVLPSSFELLVGAVIGSVIGEKIGMGG